MNHRKNDKCGIYGILNLETGALYIGQSAQMRERWNGHYSHLRRDRHANPRLQHAWNKHGADRFTFIVIQDGMPREADALAEREDAWIKECASRGLTLYNASLSSKSMLGVVFSAESRERMGASKRGRPLSAEHKLKLSLMRRGKPKSAEWRAKISAANKGQIPWGKGKPHPFRGKIMHDEETRNRISAGMTLHRATLRGVGAVFAHFWSLAAIISPLPNQISNGQTADAVPLMADLNHIVNQVNANAAGLSAVALLTSANTFTQLQSGIAATNPANFPIASQVQNWDFNTLSSVPGNTSVSTGVITGRVAALPLSAYVRGQVFSFVGPPILAAGANMQFNIDGLGNAAIRDGAAAIGDALNSGAIQNGRMHLMRYVTGADLQATGFSLINPSPALKPFTPTLTFATPGNLNVVYSTRYGVTLETARLTIIFFDIVTSTFTHTTASGALQITGSASQSATGAGVFVGSMNWAGITKAGYTQIVPSYDAGVITFVASGSGNSRSTLDSGDAPTGGGVRLQGFVVYPRNT